MKTELVDVNETRRHLTVEIPTTDVESAIDRVTREYTKSARLPGFRPGKVPPSVVRQRFRAQILHDVAHDLIPRTIDSVLSAKGVEPVDTPDVKDVVVEEGKPLSLHRQLRRGAAVRPRRFQRDPAATLRGDRRRRRGAGHARAAARPRRALRAGGRRRGRGPHAGHRPGAPDHRQPTAWWRRPTAREGVDRHRRPGQPARVRRQGDGHDRGRERGPSPSTTPPTTRWPNWPAPRWPTP